MCGIGGIVGKLNDVNRDALRKLNLALKQRGPDGEGYWETAIDHGRGVLFCHRRLSILDVSSAAAQPMTDANGGNTIVLNGEIYNFEALRSKLYANGVTVDSTGDTEVLLKTLGSFGVEALSELRGMYAFGYWNFTDKTLVLARDPLGIKPLYIAINQDPNADWQLIFASEVRAILQTGLLSSNHLDSAALTSVVWNGFVTGPATTVSGIESISAGHLYTYNLQSGFLSNPKPSVAFWTFPRSKNRALGLEKAEAIFAQTLEDSVKSHLISDAPLGIFLSGGIDSSAVANLAQRNSNTKLSTFTLSFEEAEFNEGKIAERIAMAIGTNHQEFVLTEEIFLNHLEDALDSLDQPTFDGLNSYYMSLAVRKAGFKVALVGTGGDELFGGYASFSAIPKVYKGLRLLSWIPSILRGEIVKHISRFMQPPTTDMENQNRWAKLPEMSRSPDDVLRLYQIAYALFLPSYQQNLILRNAVQSGYIGLTSMLEKQLRQEIHGRSNLESISLLEQRLFLGERLLRDTDASSMAASVEIRLPLVDHMLLEAVQNLPEDHRYRPIGSKAMLRKHGLKGLDSSLFDRPKSGFVLPYERWLKANLGQVVGAVLQDSRQLANAGLDPAQVKLLWSAFLKGDSNIYWSRVWALFVFVRWWNKYGA
jgi:asparagine synthase (glutamine-hydrolysing)